ncbi:hypothetical protein BJ508DRAFT_415760 [Ascobolus immersus RN42]|uniref:Sugar phosphate transporter domain-containing protein n=1 Tax=Ascobolus immersus RN42 TaxID=1160509 RepID=A0A3N4I6P8_ASCIM|nr:hypothetical protein BJ508DRAFT_415760 [Ascobolus immersus RN42]
MSSKSLSPGVLNGSYRRASPRASPSRNIRELSPQPLKTKIGTISEEFTKMEYLEAGEPQPAKPTLSSLWTDPVKRKFLIWTLINTLSTIGIVFTNKSIFEDPTFRGLQTTFACFHFICTSLTLFLISRPQVAMFVPRRARLIEILPLAIAMCANVILPNASLAYSTVTFYQIARILLTPFVALINYTFYNKSIPRKAAYAIIPVCLGVAIVSYYDTLPQGESVKVTTTIGVFFAIVGVMASSLYTVWIGSYHKKLSMDSYQLLFNQAPVSAIVLLFASPIIDGIPDYSAMDRGKLGLVVMSGCFASLINLSQFFIINGAGPVSSTVVGHAKTCSIVALGWIYSNRKIGDRSLIGIALAIGGIVYYSMELLKAGRKA